MKIKRMKLSFLIVAACIAPQIAGYASTVSGEVSAVNEDAHFLLIIAKDRLTYAKQPERIQLQDQPDTVFEGILGLDQLKNGDQVVVEAVEDKRGPWAAKKISLKKVVSQNETHSEAAAVNEGSEL